MEKKRSGSCAEQGDRNCQRRCQLPSEIVVYQNGYQNGSSKHSEHVLNAEEKHFSDSQFAGIVNGLLCVRHHMTSRY